MLLLASAEDHDLSLVLGGLRAEDWPDKRDLASEFGVEYLVLGLSIGEDKGRLFDLVDKVEHSDAGTPSHEGIIPRLVTAIRLHIGLHIFVIDICIRLKQLLVEAGLVE